MVNWRTIIRNVFSNGASYFVTAAVGFFLAPFILHRLGNTGYGLWTLVLSLTGYCGLLDLGIRSSVGRFVARHVALGESDEVSRIASTAFAALATAGLLALAATAVIAARMSALFHAGPQYDAVAREAMVLTGLNVALALPLGVFSAVLIALERFDVLGGISILSETCRAALVVVTLRSGGGLVGLGMAGLAVSAGAYSVMFLFARRLYPTLRLRPSHVNRGTAGRLFGYGIYRFVWIVANQLIFYSDSVVIGIFLGASAVPHFAIAGTLVNYGRTVASLVSDTLCPAATRLDALGDLRNLQQLFLSGTRLMLLIALLLCIGFVFLGRQFIVLWVGGEYAGSAVILSVLAIAQLGAITQYASTMVLSSMARHQTLAYAALAEGLANLVLSIVLVKRIGLIGVAWGTVVPDVITSTVIVPWYAVRVLKLSWREYVTAGCVRPVAAAVPPAFLAWLFSQNHGPVTWAGFGAEAAALCGVFAAISYFLCLNREQRQALAAKAFRYVRRERVAYEA